MNRVQRELDRAVAALRLELDRVELLTAAVNAFSRPIPDYEPSFQLSGHTRLSAHEIDTAVHD